MITKKISDYWINRINEKFKGKGFQTFSDGNLMFQYALIDKYIIKYSEIVNSLQLYIKLNHLPEFEKNCKKEELVCSYGESEKSIDVCIDDILKRQKEEENIKNTDWSKYCLHSIYHGCKNEEFYIKVHKVVNAIPTGFSGFKELCFDCQCFENQGYDTKREFLRVSLLGIFYEVVKIPDAFKEHKQQAMKKMSIWDFI